MSHQLSWFDLNLTGVAPIWGRGRHQFSIYIMSMNVYIILTSRMYRLIKLLTHTDMRLPKACTPMMSTHVTVLMFQMIPVLRVKVSLPTSDECVPLSAEHLTLVPCNTVALKVIFNWEVKHPFSTDIPRAAILPPLQIIGCIGATKSLLVSAISPPEQLPRAVPSQAVARSHTVHS